MGVLQSGHWSGELLSSDGQSDVFELDLSFDMQDGSIFHRGALVGTVESSLAWHGTLSVDRHGIRIQGFGEFVRTAASAALQGRYQTSDGTGGSFGLYPPAPWRIELRQWERLPMPRKVYALPTDSGIATVSWSAGQTFSAGEATGRCGRWCTQVILGTRGPSVVLSAAC